MVGIPLAGARIKPAFLEFSVAGYALLVLVSAVVQSGVPVAGHGLLGRRQRAVERGHGVRVRRARLDALLLVPLLRLYLLIPSPEVTRQH